MPPTTFTGNKREVPGNLPISLWRDRVLELSADPDILGIPFFHSWMEVLRPDELKRVKAKALIWREQMGVWPHELAWWWEIRLARRRGDIAHRRDISLSYIDKDGVLHCGYCQARWSAHYDGSPHPERCKLCDNQWIIIYDQRDEIKLELDPSAVDEEVQEEEQEKQGDKEE